MILFWRHHKSNLVLPTPTNKLVEQPIKKIIPEIDITQQKQQQKQQNEQEKEEILCTGKATKKELLIPLRWKR